MSRIIFVSGACGSGKTEFSDEYARFLAQKENKEVYVIHGDDFHAGFVEPAEIDDLFINGKPVKSSWSKILKFNWNCIILTANEALKYGVDVVIDYVIEDELSRVINVAEQNNSQLYYIVLTASEEELIKRINERGDTDMIERSLYLKEKLDNLSINKGHILDNTGKNAAETVEMFDLEKYRLL